MTRAGNRAMAQAVLDKQLQLNEVQPTLKARGALDAEVETRLTIALTVTSAPSPKQLREFGLLINMMLPLLLVLLAPSLPESAD